MKRTFPTILILGATGSIGYAVAANLLARHLPVTILVRNRAKAEALFPNQPTLTLVEGDVQDAGLLDQVATGKDLFSTASITRTTSGLATWTPPPRR